VSDIAPELEKHVLRPSPEEIRGLRILFYTQRAAALGDPKAPDLFWGAVLRRLRDLGAVITLTDDAEAFLKPLDYDFVFCTQLPSTFDGHELFMPTVAAFRGVPCLGAPPPIRAMSEDKVIAKAVAASLGVDVAKHRVIDPRQPGIGNAFTPGRWILKPRRGVMSHNISYIEDANVWRKAISRAAHPMHNGQEFIAEEFVPGLNLAAPVVEGLPPGSLPVFLERGETRQNILSASGKEGITPDYDNEPYSGPGAAEAKAAAAKLAQAMGPFDYARCDFRFEPVTNRLVFLEINMSCAMGPLTVLSRAAAKVGIDHPTLVGHILTHSLRRQRRAA
jgi:D-alanine-D-alanine ligase